MFIIWTVQFATIEDTFRIVILLPCNQKEFLTEKSTLGLYQKKGKINMDGNNPKINIYIHIFFNKTKYLFTILTKYNCITSNKDVLSGK